MDISIFPVTSKLLFSLVGSVVFAAVVLQWLKQYLAHSLWVNLADLGINMVILVGVGWLLIEGPLTERLLVGAVLGLFGASLACFGFELISNALKFAGVIRE